jgi:hypothetical protein
MSAGSHTVNTDSVDFSRMVITESGEFYIRLNLEFIRHGQTPNYQFIIVCNPLICLIREAPVDYLT